MVVDELQELIDRLVTLKVVYPDFSIRVDSSIEDYERALIIPNRRLLHYVGTDMVSLLQYFREIYERVESVREQIKPIIVLLEGLTEPS